MPSPTKKEFSDTSDGGAAEMKLPDFGDLLDPTMKMVSELPVAVKKRLCALKKLQADGMKVEESFYKRLHELELEFAPKYQQLHNKRKEIVLGTVEPTEDETNYPLYQDFEGISEEMKAKLTLDACGPGDAEPKQTDAPPTYDDATKGGVPKFWLTVLQNSDLTAGMIQEHDEPILEYLTDVDVEIWKEPPGFALTFHFAPNEWFPESTLTKKYWMRIEVDPKRPFLFEGPEIIKCEGTPIQWKEGRDVTTKLIKKKQKHKHKAGATRFVTKQIKQDSFFNFFDPPQAPVAPEENGELVVNLQQAEVDEQISDLLEADYEIGQALRDQVIPRAVLYFTGEAVDGEDEDFTDESDEGDDDEDDELDDDEDDDE